MGKKKEKREIERENIHIHKIVLGGESLMKYLKTPVPVPVFFLPFERALCGPCAGSVQALAVSSSSSPPSFPPSLSPYLSLSLFSPSLSPSLFRSGPFLTSLNLTPSQLLGFFGLAFSLIFPRVAPPALRVPPCFSSHQLQRGEVVRTDVLTFCPLQLPPCILAITLTNVTLT